MVTEIMGGTHIVRPSDPAENEPKAEKTTILIMNNIPEVREENCYLSVAQSACL